jgi:hypothetical protein
MAQYALVEGALTPVSGLGGRAYCHDPRCNWEMVAKPGNGTIVPHWAHKKGSKHALGNGEKGEWHQEVQSLFRLAGAQTEVEMPSADGIRQHRADVVCANGRIIEAQTTFLEPVELASREATYGTVAWLYDAHDTHKWFIINNPNDPARFDWGKPNRRFMSHTKPVFFDTPDGVWQLERMSIRHEKGRKGRPIYEGVRRRVADDLLDFVTKVTEGKPFGSPPVLAAVDVAKKRGTKFRTVQPVDEWLAANPGCEYVPEPVAEVVRPTHQPVEIVRPTRPVEIVRHNVIELTRSRPIVGTPAPVVRITKEASDAQAVAAMAARMTAAGWPGPMRRDGTYPKIGEA